MGLIFNRPFNLPVRDSQIMESDAKPNPSIFFCSLFFGLSALSKRRLEQARLGQDHKNRAKNITPDIK